MQQNNLPAQVDPNVYPLQMPVTEVLPPVQAHYVPNMDQYSAVCVHVREASFIASNDPNAACGHVDPHRPLLHGPTQKTARQKRFLTGPIAAWLCVLQLGVIIWMLAGKSWRLDIDSMSSLRDSLLATAGSHISLLTNGGGIAPITFGMPNADYATEPKTSATKPGKKKKGHGKKASVAPHFKGFSWPTVDNFVPPPPPSMPVAKMLVPPPPVAYPLDKGPGAVAASTLPPPPDMKLEFPVAPKPAKKEAAKPEAKAHPVAEKAPETAPPKAVAVAPHVEPEAPAPGVTEQTSEPPVPVYEAPSPVTTAAIVPAPVVVKPAPPAPHHVAVAQTAPVPVVVKPIAPAPHHVAVAPAEPTTPAPIRTVMSGNRKRIITDR